MLFFFAPVQWILGGLNFGSHGKVFKSTSKASHDSRWASLGWPGPKGLGLPGGVVWWLTPFQGKRGKDRA